MYELTAQDTRALRSADSICFDHLTDGTAHIRAIQRAERSSSGFEQTHTIPVEMSRLNDYGGGEGPFTAFHMVMSAQHDETWGTVLRRLRPGAQVAFVWVRDNNNDILRDAGLHQDEFRLDVQQRGAKVCDRFAMRTSVGYDNSARMVKRG